MRRSSLPHSLDTERAVLTAALMWPTAWRTLVDELAPEDFLEQRHRAVFAAIRSLAIEGHDEADAAAVMERLQRDGSLASVGGRAAIIDLLCEDHLPAHSLIGDHCRRLRALRRRRDLTRAADEIRAAAHDEGLPEQEMVARVETAVAHALSQGRTTASARPASSVAEEVWDDHERARAGGTPVVGIPSGWTRLDTLTGGWQPRDLVTIAARTGIGKTTVALHLAAHAARQGTPTLVVSLEMAASALMARLLAAHSGLPERFVRTAHEEDPATGDYSALARSVAAMRSLPLVIDDGPRPTLAQLASSVRLAHARGQCRLLVVDQLGNLQPTTRENRVQQVSELSAGLKDLAGSLGIPVLAVHQLSRESEHVADREPELHHLRDSGSVEQDSDLVLLLWRAGDERDRARPRGILNLRVAKNRRGPRADLQLMIDGQHARVHAL